MPFREIFQILPLPAWILLGMGLVFIGGFYYAMKKYGGETEIIDSANNKERLARNIIDTVETEGAIRNVRLVNRAESNVDRDIGRVVKSNTENVLINPSREEGEQKKKTFKALAVVKGKGLKNKTNIFLYSTIGKIFSSKYNENPFAIYYYLDSQYLEFEGDSIMISHEASTYNKNGIRRLKDLETVESVIELTFMEGHENFFDTGVNLIEEYGFLNRYVQERGSIMNIKWDNIKSYKQGEERQEKKEAMES